MQHIRKMRIRQMISTYNATQTHGDIHTISLNETQISQCHNIKFSSVFWLKVCRALFHFLTLFWCRYGNYLWLMLAVPGKGC